MQFTHLSFCTSFINSSYSTFLSGPLTMYRYNLESLQKCSYIELQGFFCFLGKEKKIIIYLENWQTLLTLSEKQTIKKKIGIDNVFALFPPNFSLNLNENHKRRENIAFCLSKRQMEPSISTSVCSFIVHSPAAVIVMAQHARRDFLKAKWVK